MAVEKRFVDGDVLDRHDALFALQLQHAVNQQKRITVRQNFQDVVNVEYRLGCGGVSHGRSALNHASFSINRISSSSFESAKDYTVPRCIHGGPATPASERKSCPVRKQQHPQ